MNKYIDLAKGEDIIPCQLFCNDTEKIADIENAVICCHGFAGSKDSSSTVLLAGKLIKEHTNILVISFDLPCHGTDKSKDLTLEKCDEYLSTIIDYVNGTFHPSRLLASGISFGGYLILKYIAEHGNPFKRVVVRSAAVIMHDVLFNTIMTEEERNNIKLDKTVMTGFDVKIPVTYAFLKSLSIADIMQNDFTAYKSEILMIHGTDDEVVPYGAATSFSKHNMIRVVTVPDADHRFSDTELKQTAFEHTCNFLLKE